MRRRELPFGPWGNIQTETTTTSTVDFTLSGLTAGVQYQLQASKDATFPDNDTLSELFTTAPPDPAISEVFIGNPQGLSFSVGVRISNVRSRLPVYLRYRTTPSGPWSSVVERVTAARDAFLDLAFDVEGLTPATEYESQVSLDSSFPPSETKHRNGYHIAYHLSALWRCRRKTGGCRYALGDPPVGRWTGACGLHQVP